MFKGIYINIEHAKNTLNEYIIKDRIGITIGRIYIIELSKENRYCFIRIKFYKSDGIEELTEALNLFISSLFKEMNMYKINVVVDEEVNTTSFVKLGFYFEGIISDSILHNNSHKHELLFGINNEAFNNSHRINVLRLKGKDIDLKVLIPGDSSDMLRYYERNREHLKKFEPTREESFFTLKAQREILIESYKQFLNGLGVTFGIYKGRILIGKIQISGVIFGVFKSAFIGYSMDKDEQGKGYMKEALNMVVDYAFEEMDLHRIEASTLVDNFRSQAVLRNCKFSELGINKNYLFINGRWRDHITFYRIKEN